MESLCNDRNTNMCLFVRVVMGMCDSHCGGVFTLVFMYGRGRMRVYMCLTSSTAVFSEHLVQAHICMPESARLLAS